MGPRPCTGGSSSGSGAAVAARLRFAALGSDTGGASGCGGYSCVTGLKTTDRRIGRAGAMPVSQSLDTVGPLARTVQDCALLLGLMAGADPEELTAAAGPCRTMSPRRPPASRA